MRFLLREVAAVQGHGHQFIQHRPELFEVPSLEHRVDCLDPGDEPLADLVRHTPGTASHDFPVWSARAGPYAFGISLPGSRNGFFTTVAFRRPSGLSTVSSVPSSAWTIGSIA